MIKKIEKIIRAVLPIAIFGLVLYLLLDTVHAQGVLGDSALKYLEGDLKTFRGPEGATGEELAASAVRRGISILKFLVGSAALLLGIIYAFNFIFARGREDVITKQKQNFLYLFIGFVVLLVSEQVANIFSAEDAASDQLVDFEAARDQVRDVTNYLKYLFGSIVVLLMTVSGLRLITAGGNQEVIEKEKRHLIWSGIGMLVILLATNIVDSIYVINTETGAVEAAGAETGIQQIGGVIQLMLIFLGPIAILATIYAGFMYLTSFGNEERQNKAKRMIVAGVTGIVIIYSSFALVNTLIGQPEKSLPEQVEKLETTP